MSGDRHSIGGEPRCAHGLERRPQNGQKQMRCWPALASEA